MLGESSLLHDRVSGVTGFDASSNSEVAVSDRAKPYLMRASAIALKETVVIL